MSQLSQNTNLGQINVILANGQCAVGDVSYDPQVTATGTPYGTSITGVHGSGKAPSTLVDATQQDATTLTTGPNAPTNSVNEADNWLPQTSRPTQDGDVIPNAATAPSAGLSLYPAHE